jgi:hypothetical protein
LNKFKSCDRFWKIFEKGKLEGMDLNLMPKFWRVNIAYYKGRYYMYSNDFVNAR